MLLTASDIWERGPSSRGYSPDTIPEDTNTFVRQIIMLFVVSTVKTQSPNF
jgi:hypothetical protein